jgi:hypothetical protein
VGLTACHPHNGEFIYFTVAHPNGTIAPNEKTQKALFYVDSPWMLSYWNRLRNAFLNDPIERNGDLKYEACKGGHCYSEIIPSLSSWAHPVVLKRIEDPEPLREGWHGTRCQYRSISGIAKGNIKLANIGFFIYGTEVPLTILHFMEKEIRKTYPTMEIRLICILTVGLLPCLFAITIILTTLINLARYLDKGIPRAWAKSRVKGGWDPPAGNSGVLGSGP